MLALLDKIEAWQANGKQTALATVVYLEGSALRPMGARLVVSSEQEMVGSVSGGCVEGAVVEEARQVMREAQPRLLHYGAVSEMEVLTGDVGLTCGGSVKIFVEMIDEAQVQGLLADLKRCLVEKRLVALATVVSGPLAGRKMLVESNSSVKGSLGVKSLDNRVVQDAQGILQAQDPGYFTYSLQDEITEVFIDVFPPPPRLVIVGGAHVAIPLVRLARELGYFTIVVDGRAAFVTPERFPHADQVLLEWPASALEKLALDEASYVVCLTHDEKLDNPALEAALKSKARYVGVLGGSKAHIQRIQALREAGLSDEQIERIHAPIGLDLGARDPEEIALAIIAEMIAVRHNVALKPRMRQS